MPTIVDQAFVIRVWDWSETSQTASLFCREHGALRALAKGAKREAARFSGGLELLTRGEVVAIVRPNSELATLTDWDLQEVFWSVRRSLRAHYAGLYIADLVRHFITDADPHPSLWDAMLEALRALDDPGSVERGVLRFQWAALHETGYRPDFDPERPDHDESDPDSAAFGFDPRTGRLTQDPGPRARDDGPWRVRAETVRLLRSLDDEPADLPGAAPESIDRASRLLAAYGRWVLGRDLSTSAAFFGARPAAVAAPPRRAPTPSDRGSG